MWPIAFVAWSVCLSVTMVSPAKMAEPIKMLLGTWTRLVPCNHVLDRGPETQEENAQTQFWDGEGQAAHSKV